MSLIISSLNSGSNGNCYYVGNETEAVLIDAGLSCKETEKRMDRLGLCLTKVKAIFISHEHTDHIKGLPGLSKKYQLPVYITHPTYNYGKLNLESHLIRYFSSSVPICIGNLSISAFPKCHDAADPHSFIVTCKGVRVGVFTDIGIPCENLIKHFQLCHAAFLEANYDENLLENGRYPYFLKNRIRGGNGHLSNSQALKLFVDHKPLFMSHLLLSHLSKDNNCPDLVWQLFHNFASGTEIIVASRYAETAVLKIGNDYPATVIQHPPAYISTQYSMFE
jgi:phosphoribosyl 1,2-cyclic phosphodiesterase